MTLHYTISHASAPSRYLVHILSIAHGERYLGVVWKLSDRTWMNKQNGKKYLTRQHAARALL